MIVVGTSGWQYKEWQGRFYPARLPQRLWLEHYAERFGAVEVDGTFYRLPKRETFADWRARTPRDFRVAVKMSRYLTHVKRLREPAEPVARFLERAEALGDKLGPVLVQLPPDLRADPDALDGALKQFPRTVRLVVEPRHPSWWTAETRRLLEKRHAALCWADRRSRPLTPRWRTTDFGYLRLHEGRARPWPHYGRDALASWVRRLDETFDEAYLFLNNDQGGAAPDDAMTAARAARKGR